MRTSVVIGGAFGDEGKGHVVSALLERERSAGVLPSSCVVRFSGGAQAGHTVLHQGVRHVFHTYGSGTLQGVPTYLSRFVCIDPLAIVREAEELTGKLVGLNRALPKLLVDPLAPVVAPTDWILNQLTELLRGARHGSCGYGVGECMRRNEATPYKLVVHDLFGPEWLLQAKLDAIEGEFLEQVAVRFAAEPRLDAAQLREDVRIARGKWWASLPAFRGLVRCVSLMAALAPGVAVFEGSQGLLLDRHLGVFPYVTRANTGLTNVRTLLDELFREGVDPGMVRTYHVSRPYLTRHGNGPLPHETSREQLGLPPDETNAPNPWQGTLRYAPFDVALHKWSLHALHAQYPGEILSTVLTCMDQVNPRLPVYTQDGSLVQWTREDFARELYAYSLGDVFTCLDEAGPLVMHNPRSAQGR